MKFLSHNSAMGLLLVAGCGIALQVSANESGYQNNKKNPKKMDEIVISASRVPQQVREVVATVAVIDEESLHLKASPMLSDALRYESGITIASRGGYGKQNTINIRGEEGYRTLLLLDGMEISDVSAPQSAPVFDHLLKAGISKVEILKGPQGMIYGADAGGVVNITSRLPSEGLSGSVAAEYGAFSTNNFSAGIGVKNSSIDGSVFIQHYKTDGINARVDDIFQEEDGYENNTLHASVGTDLDEHWRLHLVTHQVDAENYFDACFTQAFAMSNNCTSDADQSNTLLELAYRSDKQQQRVNVQINTMNRDEFAENEKTSFFSGEVQRLAYIGATEFNQKIAATYGVEIKDEQYRSTWQIDDLQQTHHGVFSELQLSPIEPMILNIGARYDDSDEYGNHTSYRVGAAYWSNFETVDVKWRAQTSSGFRAPSLYELSQAAGALLKEEESIGHEVGVDIFLDGEAKLSTTVFYQEIEDLIVYFFSITDPADSGYRQLDGDTFSKGIELNASTRRYPLGQGFFNYTINKTEQFFGAERVQRPEKTASMGITFFANNDALVAQLSGRYASDAIAVGGETLESYAVFDAAVNYRLQESATVFARVGNLTDKNYQEVAGYNTLSRHWNIGVEFHF